MNEYILTEEILGMLASSQQVLQALGIDFYVVGAIARDIRLSANPSFAPRRKTKDVDIAIMIANEAQFYAVKEALLATGDFTAHETESIKLFYKQSIELDLLPFGQIENEYRETKICKPRLFVMDVPGFLEVFPDAEEIPLSHNVRLRVCSLEGLILLKLLAFNDNPQRTKDLTDIDHIITVYFDLNDTLIYDEYMELMDQYDTDNVLYLQLLSARIIGIKLKGLLSKSQLLHNKVVNILQKRPLETWQALAQGLES